MNLPGIDTTQLAAAQGRLETWLAGMHGPEGYYGPVIGFRGTSMGYAGPGFDWRYEGLLDGWLAHNRLAPDALLLGRMESALAELCRARLADGTLRCSYFESNPFEGGMPHEPILMASALRVRAALLSAGRPVNPEFEEHVDRFVRSRLVRELWNKGLKTFNNWLQSEYESYSPTAVAAIVEVLDAYEAARGPQPDLDPLIRGAADSLLATQITSGPLAGALPVSNRRGAPVNPALAARCLTAFEVLARRLADPRLRQAADGLEAFLAGVARRDGGFPCLVSRDRPAAEYPVFVGAAASVLTALARSGRLDAKWLAPHLDFILAQQSVTGAFNTAVGFGNTRGKSTRPDWRDLLPVCGWVDKVYHLLALLNPGTMTPTAVSAARSEVTVRGTPAVFEEGDSVMRLTGSSGKVWFEWEKRTKWPRVNLL